jgi:hypothetical protein
MMPQQTVGSKGVLKGPMSSLNQPMRPPKEQEKGCRREIERAGLTVDAYGESEGYGFVNRKTWFRNILRSRYRRAVPVSEPRCVLEQVARTTVLACVTGQHALARISASLKF